MKFLRLAAILAAICLLPVVTAYAQTNAGPDFPGPSTASNESSPGYLYSGCVDDNDNRRRPHNRNMNCNENDNDTSAGRVNFVPATKPIEVQPIAQSAQPAAQQQAATAQTVAMGSHNIEATNSCISWQTTDGTCFSVQQLQTPVNASTSTAVVLRNGPSTISGELGHRPAGSQFVVMLERDGWVYVFDPATNNYAWIEIPDLSVVSLRPSP